MDKELKASQIGGGNAKLAKTLLPRLAKESEIFAGLERNRAWPGSKAHDALVSCLHNQLKANNLDTLQGKIDKYKAWCKAQEEDDDPSGDEQDEEPRDPEDEITTQLPKMASQTPKMGNYRVITG